MFEDQNDVAEPTELDMLRERCKLMGITYSNNAGPDTLRKKIEDKMSAPTPEPETEAAAPVANPLSEVPLAKQGKKMTLRQYLLAKATRLVRLRITNMDPKKADLPGEIFTVSNEYLGDIKKYVPFGEATDGGYHVPYCIYELLKTRQFLQIKTRTHPVTKQIETSTRYVREFALEVLPDLTPTQLKELAMEQNASGRLDRE